MGKVSRHLIPLVQDSYKAAVTQAKQSVTGGVAPYIAGALKVQQILGLSGPLIPYVNNHGHMTVSFAYVVIMREKAKHPVTRLWVDVDKEYPVKIRSYVIAQRCILDMIRDDIPTVADSLAQEAA